MPHTLGQTKIIVNRLYEDFWGGFASKIDRMDDMQERRRARLDHFVKDHGGPRECQNKFPVTESYLSQIIHKHVSFGERAARKMEVKLGLAPGYFDADEDERDAATAEILDILRLMSQSQRQAAAAMLRSFADAIGVASKKAVSNGH